VLELALGCGRCGLPASALITFNCPRCGADVREVGIGRKPGGAGPVERIVKWTLLLAVPVAAILITLESVKYYERNQQRILVVEPRGALEATFTATGRGFSARCPLDDVTLLLATPGGRTMLRVDAGSMAYATLDERLEPVTRAGRLTPAVMLVSLSSIGHDPTDPATKAYANELLGVIAAAHAGDMAPAASPSFRSTGGGAGYSAGANRTLVNWTWFVGLLVWVAGVVLIFRRQQHIRVSPTTGAAT
jgi:hypothetical protein